MLGFIFSGCSSKEDTTANMNVDSVVKKDSRVLVNEDLKNVYFDFDKYDLTSKANDTITRNAGVTKSIANNGLTVEGHTDEWGSDEYNYALGLKRANSVKDVLVANGVTANVALVSLGESSPVCTEKTKDCWAKNRRVEHELSK